MTHPPTFSQWLRRLRTQGDRTQEALAELAFCSVQAIRAFETGRRRPSLEMAERLADVLQVPDEQRPAFIRLARAVVSTEADENEAAPTLPTAATDRSPLQPHPLPSAMNPLIGREAEINILRQLLVHERSRLVTLVGVGGMGKTRLAVEVAATLAPHFADGVAFVPVAALRAAAHLPGAIAAALQLPLGSGDPGEQVLGTLANRHLLLLLDSFEELLHQDEQRSDQDAVAWVNRLLQQSPSVQLLVTSRERLRLRSERPFELGGLALPTVGVPTVMADAVMLFLERAQQSTSDFRLDSSNQAAVARICQLVDGIPLGIELAAAWVNVLGPAEIASELENNIDLLARANRDATPRHRSMRAVFDHSWALLNDEERTVLGRLAVFRGGCQREAAQTVAKASLPLLAGLIDKSLVRRRQTDRQARYELHEVVRQYAAEKRRSASAGQQNGEPPAPGLAQDEVWLAHYTYFYKLAATARPHLYDREQLHWLQILDEEHANLRAALDRALRTQDLTRGLQLAIQLEEYWYIRGHHREGLQRLLDFLALAPATLAERDVANGYVAATILAIAGGNYCAAQNYIERSMATIRRLGDQAVLSKVLRYWGLLAIHEGDYAAAEAHASEALQLAMALNNRSETATTLTHLAEIALIQQNYQRAQELGEQAVQILRRIEDKNQLAGALRRLAQVRIQQGQWGAARQEARESLALNNELADQRGTAASLIMVAALPAAQAAWTAVAQLLGAATHLLTQAQASLLPADQLVYDALRQRATTHLPTFAASYEAGWALMAQQTSAPYDLTWIDPLV